MKLVERARSDWYATHYKVQCEYCKEEVVGTREDFNIINDSPEGPKQRADWKCPNCGHINSITRDGLNAHYCDSKGDDHIIFELSDNETKAAREFIREHKNCCSKDRPFTALGMQYTYEIIPGGFGNGVTIKCNVCKKSKDITDTENW